MSGKQAVLEAINSLTESATWAEVTDALVGVVARNGSQSDVAKLYRQRLTADDLAEYLAPKLDVSLDAVVAELEGRSATGAAP